MLDFLHLGSLVTSSSGIGPSPPLSFDQTGIDTGKVDVDKAIADSKKQPSIWFVNFPSKEAETEASRSLKDYMQDVEDYRSWASAIWWENVTSHPKVPQDLSFSSTEARSSYFAKVAMQHMKFTPWLYTTVDHATERNIDCDSSEFHMDLLKAVLSGFVDVNSSIRQELEDLLKSLTVSVKESTSNKDVKTVVCERYEYLPIPDLIRSYVRVVNFTISNDMKHVNSRKKESIRVKCHIEYNEYEAGFNRKNWSEAAMEINDQSKDRMREWVKQRTINCEP